MADYLNYLEFIWDDVSKQDQDTQLNRMTVNLCSKEMLRAVFFYEGKVEVENYTYIKKDKIKCLSIKKHRVSGYFLVPYKQLMSLVTSRTPIFDIYNPEPYKLIAVPDLPIIELREGGDFIHVTLEDKLNIPVINFSNIKFLKSDIDSLVARIRSNNQDIDAQINSISEQTNDTQAQITKLTKENDKLQSKIAKLESQLVNANSDNSIYTTPAIEIMNKVIAEFWIDYDLNDPAPKQSTITDWITNNFEGISDALALNIDKVCRHTSARSGGKYKR